MVALKTILKEIDPYAFDEALRLKPNDKKKYGVKQDEDDRKNFDSKWEKINSQIKTKDPGFVEPNYPFKSSELIRDYNELYRKIYDKEKYSIGV